MKENVTIREMERDQLLGLTLAIRSLMKSPTIFGLYYSPGE
jgi:hypothetical protein